MARERYIYDPLSGDALLSALVGKLKSDEVTTPQKRAFLEWFDAQIAEALELPTARKKTRSKARSKGTFV